jgi:hypothetical protein
VKKYAVLSWPLMTLVGFVWAKDCALALAEARKKWQGGVLAVRKESR